MSGIGEILLRDVPRLVASLALDISTARVEVQLLLQEVLRAPRSHLLAHPEQALDAEQQAEYDVMLARRLHGEPIAYILGEREFFGLKFGVSPATLIPRPETELLVELALQRVPRNCASRVLDLGTGSGAIALAIAHARPDATVVAVDASPAALEVATANAERLDVHNVRFARSNWFSELGGQRFDLIVANPPYVAAHDEHLSRGDVRFEPVEALASGMDGLDDIRCIVGEAKLHMADGAWLLLEHGYDQAAQVRELLRQAGLGEVFSVRDLSGIERVSGGTNEK